MQVVRIGLDLAKYVFQVMVSMHAGRSSCGRRFEAMRFHASLPICQHVWWGWRHRTALSTRPECLSSSAIKCV